MVTPELVAKAVSIHVYKDEKFSDHASLVVEYDYAVWEGGFDKLKF